MKTTPVALIAVFFILISTATFAEKRAHRQPPPEAFEACENKSEGDKVSITTPRGDTLEAICKLMQESLVAVPERGHDKHAEKNPE